MKDNFEIFNNFILKLKGDDERRRKIKELIEYIKGTDPSVLAEDE
jgi:hypothetical protein